ncbi:hypothetical protein EGM88_13145 [Aureibaculum marinum]|uniref:Uncharacterized protein n=1 Tax=Aureibaculum marinum TaxID=2487930 RepID=A0A3N4P244_9FLAO|nr:hypothetical protein [Aureibaculum marinum]RPD93443.1 hypothetical protein EGM88_13145 [Aureibaculum marinum]
MFDENDDDYKSPEEIAQMPIYKKAWEIMLLGRKIGSLVSKDDFETSDEAEGEMLENYANYIIENALIIPAKIAGAEGADLYDIRMENAAIIRKSAREILTSCSGMLLCGYQNDDYIQLLRNEIEEFRVIFAEWVKTFDQENYMIDRWGLFNPPGVNYDDYDPDEDMPFDPDDFFE